MTDAPTWRAYVEAMVAKAQQHQDEDFYRLALPGWQAELRRLRGGDAQAPDDEPPTTNHQSTALQGDSRL